MSTDARRARLPELAARCGTAALRRIAACLALSRAERVQRYLVDHGVHPGHVRTSASVSGDASQRNPDRVDVTLAP